MKGSARKELHQFKQCLNSCNPLLIIVVLLVLVGIAAGRITVKRSPEPSALYWPVEEASTYTFSSFPFLLHDTTKSHEHAREEWSFRKSRQFRPRIQKRRQQIRPESDELFTNDGDFGAKIAARRIIDLGRPDQLVASSKRMVDQPVVVVQQNAVVQPAVDDQDAAPSENIRFVRHPKPVANEEVKIGKNETNITVINGGWQPISESPKELVKSSPISPHINQSHPLRYAQLLRQRKWQSANTTLNGTDVLKKKEEYLVTKVQNAEIFKDAIARRESTNRLLNRLHSRLQTTSTHEPLEVESVSVQPIAVQTSSSVVIRAGNRTRVRVNRRPALSFTVQNPFSIAVLQVNITPPEPTTMAPTFDVEPSVKLDTTLELQSVESKKNDDIIEEVDNPKEEVRFNPPEEVRNSLSPIVTTTEEALKNETVEEPPEDAVSRKLDFIVPSQAVDKVRSSTEAVEHSQAFDKVESTTKAFVEPSQPPSTVKNSTKAVITDHTQAFDKVKSSTETVQYTTPENVEKVEKVQVVDSFQKGKEVESEKLREKPVEEIIKGVDAMDFIKSIVDIDAITKSVITKEAEMQNKSLNGTLIDVVKNNSLGQQPRAEMSNKSDRVNTSVTRNLEQVTRSASDFLFELPKTEADPSKPQRPNRTFYVDDVSRFNEEQRQISKSYAGEENTDGAEKIQPSVTSVYFVGIIGIIPIAGGALYLAKIFKRKRLERLHDSDTASVTGFRKGNALLQPLHLGPKKSNKPSGRYEGAEIIAQVRVSPWEFPRSKLRLLSVIGEGNFGQVWKAEAEDICGFDGRLIVAVKTVKEGAAWREKEELLREIKLMQQLGPHQNVVSILGCCTDHEPYYLIMEYVMSGRLLTYLRNHRVKKSYYNFSRDPENLTSRDLTSICYNVAKGMEFIASKGIIHRDLAARNVLIDHNKVAKVADFGLSRSVRDTGSEIYEQRSKGALPIRWMAPESLAQSVFTKKSDVWSFGVFAWEVVTLGSTPYPGLSAREVMRRVRENLRLERPPHCKPELYKIMTRCWASDPSRRPDFTELKQEFAKMLDCSNEYVDFDKFHESAYHHTLPHRDEEKV